MRTRLPTASWQKNLITPWHKFKQQWQEMRLVLRAQGFKALISRYGWKFFALVFCYYLIRDVTLYILIPFAVAKFSFFK